jgi:gliding motility-associated-like protein
MNDMRVVGQTFPGPAGALIPPGAPGVTIGLTTATLTVSGVGIIGEGCTKIDNLAIDITHTYTGDLGIFLISPGGAILEMSSGNGGTGNNFTNTVFTDNTTPFITSGTAPYTGIWRPEGRQQSLTTPYSNANPLGTYTFQNVFDGENADGDWTLYINDFLLVDVGVINSWSITFTGGPGPIPSVDLGPDILICEEQQATLVADVNPGADSWEWSTGETTPAITVDPAVTTTYMVTVTNNGCTDADTITVQVQANTIDPNAGQDEVICDGLSVQLNGQGGGPGALYEWSNGDTGSSTNVTPDVTTIYTLTITEGVCSGTDEVEVSVTPNPVADAGPDVSICDGASADLEATGGVQGSDYSWSTGEDSEDITVSPFVTTTYTVTVTVDGCEDEDDVEVTVLPQPFVDAGDDESICIGDEILLTASGTGGIFEWSTGETGDQIEVSPSTTTSYTVSLTEDGCTATDEVEVEVVQVIADITPDLSLCEGESVVISASGGSDYEWSTGSTSPAFTASPTFTTVYVVTVSEGACYDIASVEVEVFPAPMAAVSGPDEICAGDTVTITASGGTGYQWSNGASGPSIAVFPNTSNLYIVTVSDAGCMKVDSHLITVNPSPAISIGPPFTLCEGDSVTLQVTGLTGNEVLTWNTGDTDMMITVSPVADALYAVTATNSFGCMDESSTTVTVLPRPVASAGPDVFILAGGMATLSATGTGTYLWSTGESTSTIVVNPAVTTTYTLIVMLNGCADVDEVTVFVNEVPPVDLGADLTICSGESVTLNAIVPGPFVLAYQWSTGETGSSITVMPLADSTYFITVTDITSGFFSIDSIHVLVATLPLGQPVINGPDEECLMEVGSYAVAGVSGATTYTWIISGGTLLSGQGTQSVNVEWTTPGTQNIMLVVANDCGSLPAVMLNTNIMTIPVLAGPVNGFTDPCVFSPSPYSVASATDALTYTWSVAGGGVITSGQGTTAIVVDWNGAISGTVCVEANNDCGVSSPVCLNIMPTQSPVISAGPDLETCDLMLNLQGMGTGIWSIVSGGGLLTINDFADPQAQVTSQSTGVYTLTYEAGTAGCEVSDTAVISFLTSPSVSQLIEICSNDLLSYTVSFQITGGQAPYSINGTVATGNQFESGQIAAGDSYLFEVEDSNGCQSSAITGVQSCNCTSYAGLMNTDPINRCIGDSLIAIYPVGAMTGPDDTIAFVLHDGLLPGGIIAWNDQPVFPFILSLQAGTPYYISAVVGPKGTNGYPDPSDPCFSWSVGTPFLFFNPPQVALQELDTIACDPQMVQLDIGGSSSGPEYTYLWAASSGGLILGATDAITIVAASAGLYTLTIGHPLSGCVGKGEIHVAEDHVDLSMLQFETQPPFCTGDCNGQVAITQSGSNWQYDFGSGVFTDEMVFQEACSGSYMLMIRNAAGCIADTVFTITEASVITVDLGPDRTIHPGEMISLEAFGPSDFASYNWFTADTCTQCPVIIVQPEETTLFQVEVVDEHGCATSDEVLITVLISKDISLPNIFSPNGDGVNDELAVPAHPSIAGIERFVIYDRWGSMVFNAVDQLPGSQAGIWDGTFKESPASPGVYTCIAEVSFLDGTFLSLVWDVTLVR